MTKQIKLLVALTAALALLGAAATTAFAAPVLHLYSASDTTAVPGSTFTYHVQLYNAGDEPTGEPLVFEGTLSGGLTVQSLSYSEFCEAQGGGAVEGASAFVCTLPFPLEAIAFENLPIYVNVPVSAPETVVAHFAFSAPGGSPASAADPTVISATPPAFGIDAFDAQVEAADGSASTGASGHPYEQTTSFDLNTFANPKPLTGEVWPIEPVKDATVDLPPGLIGNPSVLAQCTAADLAHMRSQLSAQPLCSPASQVGGVQFRSAGFNIPPLPLYNLVPPPGVPARFGFNILGTVITLDARVRSGGDYGISVTGRGIPEGVALSGNTIRFWGVPASADHRSERACPGELAPGQGGFTCAAGVEPAAFFRNPTSCTAAGEGQPWALHVDSWFNPGALTAEGTPNLADPNWHTQEIESHELPGYPWPRSEWGAKAGTDECEKVPFTPSITVQPTTNRADSPTGLNVDLTMPQQALRDPTAIAQADVKGTRVTQPLGTRVNPATADGLTGCSEEEVGFVGSGFPMPNPTHFTSAEPTCPDSSKIGTVEIESPLLPDVMKGGIYQAKQNENPFGSTLAFYAVASADGVMIKLPAEVKTDPQTGQVTTIFRDNPQLPFEHYKLHFFGGSKAPLITPPTCGLKATHSTFTGWANPEEPVHTVDYFEISEGANGTPCPEGERERPFAPAFEAGTQTPIAGAFSPFVLKVGREDGMQELSGIETTLPPGLLGKLAGIPYCPEAAIAAAQAARGLGEQASPACPAASQVGVSDAAAGAGPTPFHNPGKVYLAGPYKGAPLSLAIVTPALAGPLDLGTVVVRAALNVDPVTTQIHVVSDPLPSILTEGGDGFPLDLRRIEVQINRPGFTLNPTSCDPMSVDGTISSTLGTSAAVSNRFQVGACEALGFKPKLSLRLKGETNRGAHPALKAVLTMKPGQANIARAQVTLPHAEFLDQGHIRNVCTRVQFAAGGCPQSSILGYARAFSPLLDQPLQGPVYLMSGFGHKLPDLAADLNGQIRVLLHGRIDTGRENGIRNTFEVVPDAPVTKFTLSLKGGARGLIVNSESLCAKPQHAVALFDAQNGKTHDFNPLIKTDCGGKARKHKRHGG